MESLKKNFNIYLLLLLVGINTFVWYAVSKEDKSGLLTVAMLNIGQGDAILIEAPNGNQIIFDGGPSGSVLFRELKSVMPFYDHSVDAIVVTNPDKDHLAGFIPLLSSYNVGLVIEPGTISKTAVYKALEGAIKDSKIKDILVRKGTRLVLDKDVWIDFLFPDRDVSKFNTNDGSIVAKLNYRNFSMMLTGDSPQGVEKYLIDQEGFDLESDILKVGHHGSRTSTSRDFVGFVSPKYALISDGLNNTYGHPHKETIDTLENAGVKILRTDQNGRIVLVSDGDSFAFRN